MREPRTQPAPAGGRTPEDPPKDRDSHSRISFFIRKAGHQTLLQLICLFNYSNTNVPSILSISMSSSMPTEFSIPAEGNIATLLYSLSSISSVSLENAIS